MGVKDDSQYPILTELINVVDNLKDDGITLLGDEVQRKADEITRMNNETARQSAETARAARMEELKNISAVDFNNRLNAVVSGSPKGVYATLAALQTAKPTGDNFIYLVTADGKWYYWNSSAWTAGGTYQGTGLSDGTVTPLKLDSSFKLENTNNLFNKYAATFGKGFDSSGNYIDYANFYATDYIPVVSGDILYKNQPTSRTVLYDINKAILSVTSFSETNNNLSIANVNCKYIRFMFNTVPDTLMISKTPITAYETFYKLSKDSIKNLNSDISQLQASLLPWNSKKWTSYGDSITALGNDGNTSSWQYFATQALGFGTSYPRGIGGQKFCWNVDTFYANADGSYNSRYGSGGVTSPPAGTTEHKGCFCSWDRITTMIPLDSDLIFIMGGTNDFSQDKALGTINFDNSRTTDAEWYAYNGAGDYDIGTFKGGIASTIMKVQKRCPNAVIVLGTQLNGQTNIANGTLKNVLSNNLNLMPQDYANAMKEVATYFGIPCVDVFGTAGINVLNSNDFIADGTHPSLLKGAKALARAVIGGLKNIVPYMN